jgi:hypothetical protein
MYNKEYNQKNFKSKSEKQRYEYELIRKTLVELMGNCCSRCKFEDWRALQLDHVNGDGAEDRKINGKPSLRKYKEMISNPKLREHLQLLCANCNWIKRYENNENRRRKIAIDQT